MGRDRYLEVKLGEPAIQHLGGEHVNRFLQTYDAAVEHDPLINYLRRTKDAERRLRIEKLVNKIIWKNILSDPRRYRYTVNAGDSSTIADPPAADIRQPPRWKIIVRSASLLFLKKLRQACLSPEQCRREKEVAEKVTALNRKYISESEEKEMVYLGFLGTHPDFQGRGYATALLNTILAVADGFHRTVFLHTGNPANIEFYSSFGFVYIGEALMGSGNPNWDGPPVPVPLMIRKPQAIKC